MLKGALSNTIQIQSYNITYNITFLPSALLFLRLDHKNTLFYVFLGSASTFVLFERCKNFSHCSTMYSFVNVAVSTLRAVYWYT